MTTQTTITLKEMISQRGYKIENTEEDKIICINKKGEKIVVFTDYVIKFNVDRVKEYISILHKMGENHCIVMYSDSITPMAKKLILNSVDIKIELFTQDELMYNITKHRLVPKHIKLFDKDALEFKKKFGIKFPVILLNDPISRFYNYNRGDVIKIIRGTGDDTYITHRIVKG